MNELEKRLKQDANAIDADVSTAWRARMEASLRATERLPAVSPRKRAVHRLWLASSLTGLASAIGVIAVMNWQQTQLPSPADSEAMTTVPRATSATSAMAFLDIRTADFTGPLEEELEHLQSDLEKARLNMQRDLDIAF